MTYFHDPDAFPDRATTLTYSLVGNDMSGHRPDWVIDTKTYFHRIAPGCQYLIVARDSVKYPGYFDLVKIDSPLELNQPGETLVEGVGWRGLGISPDAKTVHYYAGKDPTFGYVVGAANVRTGAKVASTISVYPFSFIGGVDLHNHVMVALHISSDAVGMVATCLFGVGNQCETGTIPAEDFDFHDNVLGAAYAVSVSGNVWLQDRTTGSNRFVLAEARGSHARLTYSDDVSAVVTGEGVVVWEKESLYRWRESSGTPGHLPPPDRTVLNGTTNSFPQFSSRLGRDTPPIPSIWSCFRVPRSCP
jgi:hypothetical protein